MVSLIETCELSLVNPKRYVTHVVTCLVDGWSQPPHRRTHAVALADRAGSLTTPPRQGRAAPLTLDKRTTPCRQPSRKPHRPAVFPNAAGAGAAQSLPDLGRLPLGPFVDRRVINRYIAPGHHLFETGWLMPERQ